MVITGAAEPIEIKLSARRGRRSTPKLTKFETAIKKIKGVVDTKNGVVVSGPAITFKIDPQRASRFGVTADDIAKTAETAMTGDEASQILQQDRLIRVRVVFPPTCAPRSTKLRFAKFALVGPTVSHRSGCRGRIRESPPKSTRKLRQNRSGHRAVWRKGSGYGQ